ncbi:unnamed protein product [Plutella xylostella]|uniref:(diamondback moth) hypothetical protein n=1 Tax=Plutella xylostella TaxID=51655 RepID=A0A8S4G1U2_PLUXY|nr:unnamed protein product [Plutella xylostella]
MKKTQKLKHNYESSESSDDESLLAVARKKRRSCKVAEKYRINVDNPLCDVRQEACEFCDRTFSNRLQSLVHNSKHIIIPLIKCDASQPLHKQRSTSPVKELPKFNNKIILGKKKMNNTSLRDRIVFDDDDPDVIVLSDTDSIEENKIKGISKEVAKLKPDNNENILNSFVSDCRVILDDTISLISTIEPDEDIIVNQHHNNDTSQLGNNLNNHHIQGKTTVVSQERGLMDNKSIDNIEDKVYSVHNDELLRTATHYCEFCHREFPNRFKYIQHKRHHLRVRIARPDYCVVCDSYPRRRLSVMCARCTQTHGRHYDSEEEPPIDNHFPNSKTLHEERLDVSYLRLCDICAVFKLRNANTIRLNLKKKATHNKNYRYTQLLYSVMMEINDIGADHVCEHCGNAFSEGKIIERKNKDVFKHEEETKTSMMSKLQFEEDCPVNKPRNSKSLSNVQRLSRIKQRFKKIRKINQC